MQLLLILCRLKEQMEEESGNGHNQPHCHHAIPLVVLPGLTCKESTQGSTNKISNHIDSIHSISGFRADRKNDGLV